MGSPLQRSDWLQVMGEKDTELRQRAEDGVAQKLAASIYTPDEMERIRRLDASLVDEEIGLDEVALGKLRRLCQIWDVDIRVTHISSHRPIIGPVIVFCKRLFLPILRFLLKDSLRQQRDFNATAISLLADIASKRKY